MMSWILRKYQSHLSSQILAEILPFPWLFIYLQQNSRLETKKAVA
jgi:hypothetical protein